MEKKMKFFKKINLLPFLFSLGAWNGNNCKQIYKHGTKINMQVTEKKRKEIKINLIFLQTNLDC
jgi:hypothetical protein